MGKLFKREIGITLIALVITIIVLLILAGVTIATLTGDNGLLTKAGKAKEAASESEIGEQIQLCYLEYQMQKSENEPLEDFMRRKLETTYGTGNVTTSKMGINCKIDIAQSKKIYILKYDGNIKEVPRIEKKAETSVYGKLDENNDKILHLKATKATGYEAITRNWIFYDVSSSFSGIEKVIIDEDIAPKYCLRFSYCSELTEIENIEKLHTENTTNMWCMFYQCTNLESIDLSNFDTSNVTDMHLMFSGCPKLKKLDLTNFDTSSVSNMQGMFYNCGVEELDLSSFDTKSATKMEEMFYSCTNLTTLNVSSFNTSNLESMSKMFYTCSNLRKLDLASFDTTNVKDMVNMFSGCGSLSSVNVSSFNTSNVTNMSAMFQNCNSLVNLDLSNFDTSSVTNMRFLFQNANNLKNLNLGRNFVIDENCDIGYLFSLWTNIYETSGLKIKAIQSTANTIINMNGCSITNDNFEIIE